MKKKIEEKKTKKFSPKNLKTTPEEPSATNNEGKREQLVTTSKLEQEEIYLVELGDSELIQPEDSKSIQPTITPKTKPPQKKSTSNKSTKSTKSLPKIKPKPSTKKNQIKKPATKSNPSSTPSQSVATNYLINRKDDQDLKKLFIHLDELLSHLPEEKINQFAHSKYYAKYMNILKKLKI